MKTVLKSKVLFIFLMILCLFVVGCGGDNPAGGKSNYNEANYTLYGVPTFETQLTLEEARAALTEASNYFATVKSYSYTQTLVGSSEEDYEYQGTTKIDVTGTSPMASIELTGSNDFAFYVADNKAYFNYDGYKVFYELESDLSNIIDATEESIGAFSSFKAEDITAENMVFAGVDKDKSTVIKYNLGESSFVVVVISEKKIMKVMHYNEDSIEYIANYDYTAVTVTLPTDLSEYKQK